MRYILFLILITAITLSFGCNKDDFFERDRNLILQYIEDNNLTAEEGEYGMFYIIDVPGGAEKPNLTDMVTVTYRGELLDGSVFDEVPNANQDKITFGLAGVIQGWQLGIPLFGRGGSGKLLIPSALGYGARSPSASIPSNSVLIFDIELINF